jgi:large subunit ribosomal protein L10e
MATLRKGNAYRKVVRAYTRTSKYKKKGFIKTIPASKIARFHMGNTKKEFPKKVQLVATEPYQIRHNALESARVLVNRKLQEKFGSKDYHFYINVYPHHVLRNNRMLAGAGADRMQTGMKQSFGKVEGTAAQVKKGTVIFTAEVEEKDIQYAKEMLMKTKSRISGRTTIKVI